MTQGDTCHSRGRATLVIPEFFYRESMSLADTGGYGFPPARE